MTRHLYIYIYTLVAFIGLTATSCTDRSTLPDDDSATGEVTVMLRVAPLDDGSSTSTRSFCDKRDFVGSEASVKVLTFDENHLLANVYEGAYQSTDGDCNYYSVTLKTTDRPRIVHIIVNHNALSIHDIPFGAESDIFTSDLMTVADSTDVYWARVELPNGVSETTASEAFAHLKLVRNFCKVTMALSDDASARLKDAEWGMMIIPTRGSVAPYLDDEDFADYFQGTDGTITSYNQLTAQGYHGNVPRTVGGADSFYRLTSNEETRSICWRPLSEPIYTYENEGSSGSSLWRKCTFFLRGHYVDDSGKTGTTYVYYRLSLVDPQNNYRPINLLRNIAYDITINSIIDPGYDTALEAYTRASMNNISGSTSMGEYPNVMSGTAMLRVEYMRKYILSPEEFTMDVRYVPDISKTSSGSYVTDNGKIQLLQVDGSYDVAVLPSPITDKNHALASYFIASADLTTSPGYRRITFKPGKPLTDGQSITSTVRVAVSDASHSDLYRDVEFILRERYKMQNLQVVNDDDEVNSYILSVDVPASLPKELFPLTFTFETDPTYAYPNPYKTVMEASGTEGSLFDSTNKNAFHFHRTVTWTQFSTKLSKPGTTGFVEENGYKHITFFFRINIVLLDNNGSDDNPMTFAVQCDAFSPDPDADIDNVTPAILSKSYIFPWDSSMGEYMPQEVK